YPPTPEIYTLSLHDALPILRQALRGVVPLSTVDRRKLGFPTPIRVWLRGELGDWAHDVLTRSGAGELLDLGYARRLLVAHQRGQDRKSTRLNSSHVAISYAV